MTEQTFKRNLDHWRNIPWEERYEAWAYPIAIIEDRYGGVYSGGKWLAIAAIQNEKRGASVLDMLRLSNYVEESPNPWGDDLGAGEFWNNPPKWIAAGDTPEAALAALKKKNADVDWPFDEES